MTSLLVAGDELGRAYRLGERGATLVRPDGKLAWTSRDDTDADAWPQLAGAVAAPWASRSRWVSRSGWWPPPAEGGAAPRSGRVETAARIRRLARQTAGRQAETIDAWQSRTRPGPSRLLQG